MSASRVMDDDEARYMQGSNEPRTSSVLISNSKFLNDPYYRDAFSQHSLRRHGHDLATTYTIPMMVRAVDAVTDYPRIARLLAEEKSKYPEFGAWVDARRWRSYHPDELVGYRDGTLGAAIRAFFAKGYDMEFMKPRPVESDLQYVMQRRSVLHDIEHIVTGFGPNAAGEQALAICNVTANARFFTPDLAQYLSHHTYFVSAAQYSRVCHHYHGVLPTILEAMQLGIAAGRSLKRPLFMVAWEDYLDLTLDEIAFEFGFERGPGVAWDWTTEAASG